jgi:hypothetical protein
VRYIQIDTTERSLDEVYRSVRVFLELPT